MDSSSAVPVVRGVDDDTRPFSGVAQGVDEAWLPGPNNLGDVHSKKIMKWARLTVREILPRRMFSTGCRGTEHSTTEA
ncbi:hypothetical protein DEJ09_16145 [Curtobacterium sp. MCLR17_055]|nr:hypothetical protein DEJ09_16145 [Curtobacterium sp. MCLR17_055]